MCFGHQFCLSPDSEDNFSPNLGTQGKSIYGRISDYQTIAKPYGNCQEILTNWSSAVVHAQIIKVTQGCEYTVHGAVGRETIVVVEEGMGEVRFLGKQLALSPLCAIKLGPTGTISFYAKTQLHLFQASMCVSESPSDQQDNIEFCNADSQEWKLYEYEALGQEIFTPRHPGSIGLLRFMFPQDAIPVHLHPFSGRIIRPISGEGYTYMHPDRCPMNRDTFAAFDANVVHTNGPLKNNTYELWAFQLPWIESKIDTQNIAGHENFVLYVSNVPTPDRWKTKQQLLDIADSRRNA